MAKIIYVTREIGAISGGGIGSRVPAQAIHLAKSHDVTVLSGESNAEGMRLLNVAEPRVRLRMFPDPPDDPSDGFFNNAYAWSNAAYEELRRLLSEVGPVDYVEFNDYLGTAMVTLQAVRTADPLFRNTRVGVRLCTTYEMCHVLNGDVYDELSVATIYEMERYSLAYADCLTYAPGGDVLGTYQRFYGSERLAPAFPVEHVTSHVPTEAESTAASDDPLRLLYCGRYESRKGVAQLIEAIAGSSFGGWTLTMVGDDTNTAPFGVSARGMIETAAACDPRIRILDRVSPRRVSELMREHDAVISPSLWECTSNVGVEALAANRPVLATPVGGHFSIVVEGETGMLARGTTAADLRDLIERAVCNRAALRRMANDRLPARRFQEISDPDAFRRSVDAVIAQPHRRSPPFPDRKGDRPRVSVVLPYHGVSAYVEESIESVLAQDYGPLEVLIVNDGSFAPEDEVLEEIAAKYPVRVLTKVQGGASSAVAFGVRQSSGPYVMTVDPDDTVESGFLSRAVEAMAGDERIAFVTSWMRYMTAEGEPMSSPDGYRPFGQDSGVVRSKSSLLGGSCAVFRRSVLEAPGLFDEFVLGRRDTCLYRRLRIDGMVGHVIPEFMMNYRILQTGLARRLVKREEIRPFLDRQMAASERDRAMQWRDPEWPVPPAHSRESVAEKELEHVNACLKSILEDREQAVGDGNRGIFGETERALEDIESEVSRLEAEIGRLKRSIAERELAITRLGDEIAAVDREITETTARLVAIHGSRRWAFVSAGRAFRRWTGR